jgi:hypothetical protein
MRVEGCAESDIRAKIIKLQNKKKCFLNINSGVGKLGKFFRVIN